MHVFLSPHLDDAVLSCGGLIYELTQQGQIVLILTLLAGDPPNPLPVTPLVTELHQRWNAGSNPYLVRRAEDQESAAIVGAQAEHRPGLDAPYRVNTQGQALYPHWQDVIGPLPNDDPLWTTPLALPAQTQAVYAPLGVGRHADHRIVRQLAWAIEGLALYFYEDFPYTVATAAVPLEVQPDYQSLPITPTVQQALSDIGNPMTPHLIPLREAAIQAKIKAIRAHQSQLSTFWPDTATLESGVRRYAQQVAGNSSDYAERLWKRA
jgi:LmbE family N-acetylglucosaminyl deacetylase